MFDVGYGALKKIANAMCDKAGAKFVQVAVDLPLECGLCYGFDLAIGMFMVWN